MRVRNFINFPIFNESNAQIVGKVKRAVIGDDYKIAYLVVSIHGEEEKMLYPKDFKLTDNAVIINDADCIKSYLHGEELSIYEKKIGDAVFDNDGNELGIVSDFIISPEEKKVNGIEVSAGVLTDLLNGRRDLDLKDISWKSLDSSITDVEGSEYSGS